MQEKNLFSFILFIVASLIVAILLNRTVFKPANQDDLNADPLIPHPVTIRSDLPDFTILDLKGNPQSVTQWHGKILILNFWATWCPPCRKEIPAFIELQQELGAKGLQFVGIAIDELSDIRNFVTNTNINYPILVGDDRALKLSVELGNRLMGLPFSVIFDPKGHIIYSIVGELTTEIIRSKIAPFL